MSDDVHNTILYLGPDNAAVVDYLRSFGDEVKRSEDNIIVGDTIVEKADIILSYGYRHIIASDIIDRFERRIFNLHISYLPHNRGADPNLWSYLEDTPKGVTIHLIDNGIDTGNVIAQRAVVDSPDDTLRTSYSRLRNEVEKLLTEVWPKMRSGQFSAIPQRGEGSYHRLKDKQPFEHLLSDGWDTPVAGLIRKALIDSSKGTR